MGSEGKNKQKKKSSNKKSSGNGNDDGDVEVIMDDRFVSAHSDPRFRPMGFEGEKKQKKKSSKRKSSGKGKDDGEAKVIMDDRFASAQSDPRFMEAPRRRAKVAIDSRFQRVFTDKRFTSSSAKIDKRGKPTKKGNNKNSSSLKHYYRLLQEENENEKSVIRGGQNEGDDSDKNSSHTESESDGEKFDDRNEVKGFDESASSSSTDSDDEVMDDEEEDTFMQLEENIPEIEKETDRLAVVNLDWSQVRAVDLYVLLTSFLPKGGQILSVTVYPSEFGLKRLEEEGIRGPVGLFDEDEEEHDSEDDDDIDKKKLRAYELSRLRYYFAVVEFDSSATADYLYKKCDGVEFERSGNKLDLRFIPDSMNFEHQPRDVATEAPADYEGLDFQTKALQQSSIHLTWDEDEPQRAKTLKRKLNNDQLVELELKEFLASDESEADDDSADDTEDRLMKKRQKQDMYRALIQSEDGSDNDEEGNNQDMEVTFNSSLENISKRILEKKDKKSETVWDEYLRKRREKKKANQNRSKYSSDEESDYTDLKFSEPAKQHDDFFIDEPSTTENKGKQIRSTKKGSCVKETAQEAEASIAELELLLADDNGGDTNIKGYNLKPKKKKGKRGKEIPDEGKIPTADVDDPRFSSLFTSPLFALDPTDPQFKRSATYSRQIAQKQKISDQESGPMVHLEVLGQVAEVHEHEHAHEKTDGLPQGKEKHELSSIVRSLKLKSKQLPSLSQGRVPSVKQKSKGHKVK